MKRTIITCFGIFLCCVSIFAQNGLKEIGNFKSFKSIDSIVNITTENAHVQIACYGANIIRVQISENGISGDKEFAYSLKKNIPKRSFTRIRELSKSIVLVTDSITVSVSKFPLRINFYRKGGEFINGDHIQYGVSWMNGKAYNYRLMGANEKFIGLGAKAGNLNRAGQKVILWNTDASDNQVVDGDFSSQSVPFYIGIYNKHPYGLFLDNTTQTVFDFGASNERKYVSIISDNCDLNYYFFGASAVTQIISDYTALTGKVQMPPIWAFGYQSGIPQINNKQQLQSWMSDFKENPYPMDVFLLRQFNEAASKPFVWNREFLSSPLQAIDSLRSLGLHVITSINPGIEKSVKELYQSAVSEKQVATYPLGDVYETKDKLGNPIVLPDFMKKTTRAWWGKLFKNYTTMGVEGFINVNNEPSVSGQQVPDHIKFGKNMYFQIKNSYGLQMAHANADGLNELLPAKRNYILSKAGYAGLQNYAGVYLDGFRPNDAQMLASQRMLQSLGVVGMPLAGVNMAGEKGISNPELLIRWNSIAVFSPLMLYFPKQEDALNALFKYEKNLKQVFIKDLNLRYKLLPYLYASWYENTKKGLPLLKTLAEKYTWDEQIYQLDYQNQFTIGDQILVCPVASDRNTASVYLPKGNWYRLSTDSLYLGEQSYEVNASISDLPVFVKAGAIVPMQNVVKNTFDTGDTILQLHIWKEEGISKLAYYEDDGLSKQYLDNAFYKRNIEVDFKNAKIKLDKVEGNFKSKYKKIELIMHGFTALKTQDVNSLTKINESGMASYTSFKILDNSNEVLEVELSPSPQ